MLNPIFSLFQTLSEPIRVRMLHVLSTGEFSIGDLTQIFLLPQSTISRHVKYLCSTQWVQKRSEGTSNWLSFQPALLTEGEQDLWHLLHEQSTQLAQDDIKKAQVLLSMRETDSDTFFQNIKERWSTLRTSLFGDSFLLPALLSLIPSHIRVIDIGCGHGDTLLALSPFVHSIFGIDRSQAMLDIAKKRCSDHKNISIQQGSLPILPLEAEQFDFALCILVLQHVHDIQKAFDEIQRILKPKGELIIVDMCAHNKSEFKKRMGHKHQGFSSKDFVHMHFSVQRWITLPQSEETLGPPLFLAKLQKTTS